MARVRSRPPDPCAPPSLSPPRVSAFTPASRSRLTRHDLPRFPADTLFDRVARAVCAAECLPRKELYEAWEVARRVRRVIRGRRVVDLAGGHGLLAQLLLLLDDSSPDAVVVDRVIPASAARVHTALLATWPRLERRVRWCVGDLAREPLSATDLVVASHACGALTDAVLSCAVAARAAVAVLPCCHDATTCDAGPVTGWVDVALAIDLRRAQRLETAGYDVRTLRIPDAVTPKHRLLVGVPQAQVS